MQEMTPRELRARLDAGESPYLLDIREEWEVETAPFPGATHLSMQEVPAALGTLPKERDIVVICHHGGRSLSIALLLARSGFPAVWNLAGGIDGWSRQVDPTVPTY